ncbi:MAG TPA: hypothetical protein VE999_23225 [Gemmataceae bacterium]|nr:hypothetical protein [Gemmataceae bacterium]
MTDGYLDLLAIAQLANRTPAAVSKWIQRGQFPPATHRVGRRIYWTRSVAERALRDLRTPSPIPSRAG